MGSISDFLELELLDHIFNVAYSPPANVYLALCTADPTDAGTGATMNECAAANGYARTEITFDAEATRSVQQAANVEFPQASGGGWGTVTHWAVMDGDTEGADNMLAHGAFADSKLINEGNTPSVAASEIDVTFSANEISNYLVNKLLDLVFNNQAYSKPATYVALCDAVIDDTKTGATISEPSGGSYAREQVNINGGSSPTWAIAAAGLVDNTHEIALTTATASWGTIVSVAICDASGTGAGNLLFYDNTMTDQDVGNGDTAKFPIGDLDITMD